MLITIFGDNENGEITANDRLSLCFEIFFFLLSKILQNSPVCYYFHRKERGKSRIGKGSKTK